MTGAALSALPFGSKKISARTLENFTRLLSSLLAAGVPIVEPTGGHAVFVDAAAFLPEIPREHFPGWGLTIALYREGGIRAVEIGTVMFGKQDEDGRNIFPPLELVRLAVPRRVYTESHLKYVAGVFARIARDRRTVRGLRITHEPEFLRHFTAEFEEL